ncbi:MAG: hypothetical protein ABW221_18420 [Vicinamibacteria bacterium]
MELRSLSIALACALATGCAASGPPAPPPVTASTDLALAFARAVAQGDAASAHGLLSKSLQSSQTPETLSADYRAMTAYGSGAATRFAVQTTLETWAAQAPGDVQWVYVSIENDTFSEAVAVVVAREGPRLAVRSIEWGRP